MPQGKPVFFWMPELQPFLVQHPTLNQHCDVPHHTSDRQGVCWKHEMFGNLGWRRFAAAECILAWTAPVWVPPVSCLHFSTLAVDFTFITGDQLPASLAIHGTFKAQKICG